jgi:hypothetical protein
MSELSGQAHLICAAVMYESEIVNLGFACSKSCQFDR